MAVVKFEAASRARRIGSARFVRMANILRRAADPADRYVAKEKEQSLTVKDKVVVITGAAAGIGRETAVDFAKGGAKVVVTDLMRGGP